MELVETVRDVEAVVHRQGSIADDMGGGGGVTGVVVSDEESSELREGLNTPPGTANIGAVQVYMDVNENPECSASLVRLMFQTLGCGHPLQPPRPRSSSCLTRLSLYPSKPSSRNRRRRRKLPPR